MAHHCHCLYNQAEKQETKFEILTPMEILKDT